MRQLVRGRRPLTIIAVVLALVLAACSGGNGSNTAGEKGKAQRGGTLKMAGAGDVDHLDPAGAYYTVTYTLLRGLIRQLYAYPDSGDRNTAITASPDVAADMPDVSSDGKTYTITLRDGVQWDINGTPRAVTAADFVRGIKRVCNPVAPFGAADSYYGSVIVGMDTYCAGFAKVKADAASIKQYVESTNVAGLQAKDDKTLVIQLNQPRSDFINILALASSSPQPIEALDYVPDSPEYRQNFFSNGPYKIQEYVADQRYILVRNSAWKAESDPIRKAYVDRVEVALGSDEDPVFQEIQAGTVDMTWDTRVPTQNLSQLLAAKDPNLKLNEDGSSNPYMVINLQSPNAGGALKKLEVRQALNYAVNKANIIQVLGGPELYQPNGQILTPTLVGYEKNDMYATPDSKGDVAKAKELLSKAGFANGLTLTFLYRNAGKSPQVAQTLQADLAKAGITLKLKPTTPNNFYTNFLQNPDATKKGQWDLAAPGWAPDWQGNAASTFFGPLLDGRATRGCTVSTTNYGCYNNDKVNSLIDQALAAKDADTAAPIWAEADRTVMADAPWVPFVSGKTDTFHSKRLQNFHFATLGSNGDITNVWIKG